MTEAPIRLIRWDQYQKRRHLLTDAERELLNSHIAGECICPRGIFVLVTNDTKPLIDRIEAPHGYILPSPIYRMIVMTMCFKGVT